MGGDGTWCCYACYGTNVLIMRRKKTPRAKIIDEIRGILFQILIYERGDRCEICGGRAKLGTFHIMPKSTHKHIRFHKRNLLIAGWFCCHLPWHHSYFIAKNRIEPRIKELCGDDFEDKLTALDVTSKPLTMTRLKFLKKFYERELEGYEKGWIHG